MLTKLYLNHGDPYNLTSKELCMLSVLSRVQSLTATLSWLSQNTRHNRASASVYHNSKGTCRVIGLTKYK